MSKSWRLTPIAEDALFEIALWTIETFGSDQANLYEQQIIDKCEAIAAGSTHVQDCSYLLGVDQDIGLSFTRCGGHFIVFTELNNEIVILDFAHSKSDFAAHLVVLGAI